MSIANVLPSRWDDLQQVRQEERDRFHQMTERLREENFQLRKRNDQLLELLAVPFRLATPPIVIVDPVSQKPFPSNDA